MTRIIDQVNYSILNQSQMLSEHMIFSAAGNVGIARMAVAVLRIIDWFLMSPVLFDHLERRGIHVYLWVLNEQEHFDRAVSLGAHGVMTDYPSKLKTYLQRKHK